MSQSFGRSLNDDTQIILYVESKIAKANIFVVSKLKCPACIQAKDLLKKLASETGVFPFVFELHNYSKQQVKMIIKHLSAKTRIRTVPQIFINGRFIGGNDDIHRIHKEGQLVSLIRTKTKIGVTKCRSSPSDLRRSGARVVSNQILRGESSKRFSLRKNFEASRSELWYRPSRFTKFDDNKFDMPLQKSQSHKLASLKPPSLGRSYSSEILGSRANQITNVSNYNRRPILSQQRSVSGAKQINTEENWIADETILSRPAVVEHKWRPRKKRVSGEDLMSCVV